MILCAFTIHNLFGYYGSVAFEDLAPPSPDRNLCVLVGRNNHGKTSLLNALKLLFGGITERLRKEAMPRRPSGDQSYLRGDGVHWLGAMNRAAVAEGRREFGVSAELRDRLGERILLRRFWSADAIEELSSTVGGVRQDAAATRAWLEDRFPAHALPYLLFDGEQIQEMVVEQRAMTEVAMRKLFRLEPLHDLDEQLDEVVRAWARAEAPESKRNELDALGHEIQGLQIRIGQLDFELVQLQRDLDEVTLQIRTCDDERELLRRRGSMEERTRLHGDRQRQSQVAREHAVRLATVEVPWLPLVADPELVGLARERLEAMETRRPSVVAAQLELLDRIGAELPHRLFSPTAPRLAAEQAGFVRNTIQDVLRLEGERLAPKAGPGTWSGSEAQARRVLDQLDAAAARDADGALRKYREALAELGRMNQAIASYEALGKDEEDRLRELDQRARTLAVDKERLTVRIAVQGSERSGLKQTLAGKRSAHAAAEQALQDALVRERRVLASRGVQAFVRSFLQRTHRHRRAHVDEGMRMMFEELFSSTRGTVRRPRLGDDLAVVCEDERGRVVPPASVSAGTRQLIAVSLLWSLTENAGLSLPVVIDTPLARLDKNHQERVLQHYIAAAGRQVFLIPTDSEFTPDRRRLVEDRIYRSGVIVQDNGASRVAWDCP